MENTLKELVAEELGVEVEEVTMAASFMDDLGADSLDLFELVMAMEDEFGVKIPNDDLASIKTVGDALAYIKNNQ